MARRSHKTLTLALPPDEWDRLERLAAASERDAWQQARWLIRRGLDAADAERETAEERPTAEVA